MSAMLSAIATDIARRWLSASQRRVKRGLAAVELTHENMRDFASFLADDADTVQLDIIVDLALAKARGGAP